MSAFLVSDVHLNAILSFASTAFRHDSWMPWGCPDLTNPQALGELFFAANVKSVDYRYPQDAHEPAGEFKFSPMPVSAGVNSPGYTVQFLKLLDCLEYQCCEPKDWRESLAFQAIEALRSKAIRKLPGYDEAKWALPD